MAQYNLITDFGAAGNGSTDDTTAIQNAFNTIRAAGGGTLYVPVGRYKHGSISVGSSGNPTRGIKVVGDSPAFASGGFGSKFEYYNAGGTAFSFFNPCEVQMQDLLLTSSVTPTTSLAVQFTCDGTATAGDNMLQNVKIEKFGNGVEIYQCPGTYLNKTSINNLSDAFGAKWHCGSSGRIDHGGGSFFVVNPGTDYGPTNVNGCHIGANVQSLKFLDCDWLQCYHGLYINNGGGSVGSSFHTFINCAAENARNNGYHFEEADMCYFIDNYTSDNDASGVYMGSGCEGMWSFTNHDSRVNADHGFYIDCPNTGHIAILNGRICCNSINSSGTCHGVQIKAGTDNFDIIGGRFGGDVVGAPGSSGTQGYGIYVENGCTDYNIKYVNARGNVSGGIVDGNGNRNVTENFP